MRLNILLICSFAIATTACSSDQDLSLNCDGTTFESLVEDGKKPMMSNYPSKQTFYIRQKKYKEDTPCKVWTPDKIVCTNEIIVSNNICIPFPSENGTRACVVIDRLTGEVIEKREYKEVKKSTRTTFVGVCTKLKEPKF